MPATKKKTRPRVKERRKGQTRKSPPADHLRGLPWLLVLPLCNRSHKQDPQRLRRRSPNSSSSNNSSSNRMKTMNNVLRLQARISSMSATCHSPPQRAKSMRSSAYMVRSRPPHFPQTRATRSLITVLLNPLQRQLPPPLRNR